MRLVERFGGSVTVASLGPAAAEEQLRACLALGASAAVLLETPDGVETGPIATAAALHAVAAAGAFDLVLLGNEASDTGDYQVGIRLAHLLGRPVATGIKALSVSDDWTSLSASRTYRGVVETFTLPLPCVVTVKEGINLPRYPSLPGRLRAKRASIGRVPVTDAAAASAARCPDDPLRVPHAPRKQATVLGQGAGGGARARRGARGDRGAVMTVFCLAELDGERGGAEGTRCGVADPGCRGLGTRRLRRRPPSCSPRCRRRR